MRPEVDELLTRSGGAASRATLLDLLGRNRLDAEVARGHLLAPFPRTYVRPWDVDHLPVLQLAALISVGPPAALSHLSALHRDRLLDAPPLDVHVVTPIRRHPIGRSPGLRVHRTRIPTRIRTVDGLCTVAAEHALVASWPMLPSADRRRPVITAVRDRLVSTDDLVRVTERSIGLPGRRELRALIELLAAGCESELEIWGLLHVFDVPGLRHGVRQYPITAGGRRYRLDLAYVDERVAVELDGWGPHGSREARERDVRRDSALASIDWLTLRFSHRRMHEDVRGCRRETLATLAARRR